MAQKHKVVRLIDSTYQVITEDDQGYVDDVKYQGSLSDCEAWIRLDERGYL
jgi:hypothetical protein